MTSKPIVYLVYAAAVGLAILSGLVACQVHKHGSSFADSAIDDCALISRAVDWDDAIRSLNTVSALFAKKCYRQTIAQVEQARDRVNHKTYSVVKEALEFFIPEGKVTDYVLESYERGYLSFLAAASYFHLDSSAPENKSALQTEMHKLYNEESALTYNHGRDPVNALIQAAVWDTYAKEGFSSRPFWTWLNRQKDSGSVVRKFAKQQLQRLDAQKAAQWHIYEIGEFPKLKWEMTLTDAEHGYLKITPESEFPAACAADGAIVLSTRSWYQKVARRHANSYHPLVNAKSWIRAPFGVAYGITTFAAGAGIIVGGCTIGAREVEICGWSVRGGLALISQSDDVVEYTLQPDMRHWERVPLAIMIEPANVEPQIADSATKPAANKCQQIIAGKTKRRIL